MNSRRQLIPLFSVNMPDAVDKPLLEVLHSGYITQGPKVDEFEDLLARLFKNPNTMTLNSGTSALTMALRLANVGPGDEVISTPMTCSATNLPILSLGGKIVWADVDPNTGLLDPDSVAAKVTGKTKAIMVVDWGGAAPDLRRLRKIADDHNLKLIEDSAHSFGAKHTIKSPADFICFSLQAIKHITTGDGGVLICADRRDFERGKKLRWFGINREGGGKDTRINEQIAEWGYKFHMNDLNATIGIEQLKALPVIQARQAEIAGRYNTELSNFYIKPPADSAHWLYTLLLPDRRLRDKFKDYMLECGVQVSQVHRRNDEYDVFRPFSGTTLGKYTPNIYPGVDAFSGRMICIPIHFNLTEVELKKIIWLAEEFADIHGKVGQNADQSQISRAGAEDRGKDS